MSFALKVGADLPKYEAPVRQKLQRREVFAWAGTTRGDRTSQRLAPVRHFQRGMVGNGTNLAVVALG